MAYHAVTAMIALGIAEDLFPIYQPTTRNSHPDIFTLLLTRHFNVATTQLQAFYLTVQMSRNMHDPSSIVWERRRSGHILIDIPRLGLHPLAKFFYRPMNRRKLPP